MCTNLHRGQFIYILYEVNVDNLFEKDFSWENRKHFLCLLQHKAQVKFALFCANQVKFLMKDERSLKALKVTKDFLDGMASQSDCRDAAYAAAYAANATAAYAANAAAYDANANAAAYAANAAAYAAAYATAAYAANAAAYDANANAAAYAANAAAYDANAANLKQEQMIYLRELIIESLSPEYKDCWLLVVNI